MYLLVSPKPSALAQLNATDVASDAAIRAGEAGRCAYSLPVVPLSTPLVGAQGMATKGFKGLVIAGVAVRTAMKWAAVTTLHVLQVRFGILIARAT